jgi:hypothetical protein
MLLLHGEFGLKTGPPSEATNDNALQDTNEIQEIFSLAVFEIGAACQSACVVR